MSKKLQIESKSKKNLDLPVSKVKFFLHENQIHLLVGSTFGYLIFYFDIKNKNLDSNKGKLH